MSVVLILLILALCRIIIDLYIKNKNLVTQLELERTNVVTIVEKYKKLIERRKQ